MIFLQHIPMFLNKWYQASTCKINKQYSSSKVNKNYVHSFFSIFSIYGFQQLFSTLHSSNIKFTLPTSQQYKSCYPIWPQQPPPSRRYHRHHCCVHSGCNGVHFGYLGDPESLQPASSTWDSASTGAYSATADDFFVVVLFESKVKANTFISIFP